MYDNRVPPVSLEVAYRENKTGAVTVTRGSTTPSSQFPPHAYIKLYEKASVQVKTNQIYKSIPIVLKHYLLIVFYLFGRVNMHITLILCIACRRAQSRTST